MEGAFDGVPIVVMSLNRVCGGVMYVCIKNIFCDLIFTFQVNCGLHLVIQTSSLSDKNKVRFKQICI